MGTGVIEAIAVAGLVVLSTTFLARVMVAERSRRLLGGLVPDRGSAPTTFRVPRKVLVAMGVVAAWLVGARVAGVVGSLAATAVALTAPAMVARRRKRRREIATQERLAEAVSLVASAMRSGRSLHQAIELAATDLDPLLGSTFRRLADRTGLGDAMDESIDAWARDVGGPDARLVAGVLKLHRRTEARSPRAWRTSRGRSEIAGHPLASSDRSRRKRGCRQRSSGCSPSGSSCSCR